MKFTAGEIIEYTVFGNGLCGIYAAASCLFSLVAQL